jgi:hypothetical protein
MHFPATFKKMCNVWFVDTPDARYNLSLSLENIFAAALDVQPTAIPRGDQTWPIITHTMPVQIVSTDSPDGVIFAYQGELFYSGVYTYDHNNKLLCTLPIELVQEIHNMFKTNDFKLLKL